MIVKLYEDASRDKTDVSGSGAILCVYGRRLIAAHESLGFCVGKGDHKNGWDNLSFDTKGANLMDIQPKKNGLCKIMSDSGVTVAQFSSEIIGGNLRWVEIDS